MASGLFVLLLIGGVVLVGVFAYVGHLNAKKRREAFALTAARRGWSYAERDDIWASRFTGTPFGQGHDRRAANVVSGSHDDRPFMAFDYRYSTTHHSTDAQGRTHTHTETHPFSVIAIDAGVLMPILSVSPEGFITRAIGRLTNKDIELESEAFNRAFTVTCDDRKFATDVLHPQMMEFLLTLPELSWSFRDGSLLAIEPGTHSIELLDARLRAIDGILDRIPDFVWKQARGEAPWSP